MCTEHICACPQWHNESTHYDCVFINTDTDGHKGMQGLEIAQVFCFFSFTLQGKYYPCAIIHWFDKVDNGPDEDTSMWIMRPAYRANHSPEYAVIHIDSIYQAAHLIPVYGPHFVPYNLHHHHSYDTFHVYYINKYADHHAFKIAF
ncbi:hypothetical protein PAXRUDRAFT_136962 [Paxillus rubicundulus Ve08.2h10]|uniref:Uncharacterized protein n=1 Tax=Paxillus rubicundulus Ve08.2h10 TaxID=930991 RepID=A0A0D0E0T8_9AGAM|nr:hypothetical protein PAXRUDRAFT_136962 [Paxillus rubicundulus Ve08.2h10]